VVRGYLDRERHLPARWLFLDEVQYVEDWSYEVKSWVDAGDLERACLVLTGSAAVDLGPGSDVLPGRGREGHTHLFQPLDFRRFVLGAGELVEAGLIHDPEMAESLRRLVELAGEATAPLGEAEALASEAGRLLPFVRELDWLFDLYLRCGGFPPALAGYLETARRGACKEHEGPLNETASRWSAPS